MNRDILKRIIAILLLGSLLLGLIPMIALATEADAPIPQTGSMEGISAMTASIGIIGGADGPTAVLVSGNWGGMIAILAAVICSGIAVIVALKNRKK